MLHHAALRYAKRNVLDPAQWEAVIHHNSLAI